MNKTAKNAPSPDPEEQEALREIAEEREEKYGGGDRWLLSAAFVIGTISAVYEIRQKQPIALFFAACAILSGVLAAINWRSWSKKSPAQKMAVPSANPFKELEIKECSAPFTEAEFLSLKKAFTLNIALSAFGFMFGLIGGMGTLIPGKLLMVRGICAGVAIVAIYLGRRPAQRVWRAGKTSLACPKCHNLLTSQQSHVLQTGRCRKCGTVILTDITDRRVESSPIDARAPAQRTDLQARARTRFRRAPRVKTDLGRILDVLILLSGPALCIYWLGWNTLSGGRMLIGIMLLGMGAVFYFIPEEYFADDHSHSHSKHGAKKTDTATSDASAKPPSGRLPLLDFAVMLMFLIVVAAGLSYLIWTHHVLNSLQLALFSVALPGAVFLVSYFVIRHEAYHVKKTGKPAPERFLWTLIAFWVMAVFLFVVCVVNWIEKFGLKW